MSEKILPPETNYNSFSSDGWNMAKQVEIYNKSPEIAIYLAKEATKQVEENRLKGLVIKRDYRNEIQYRAGIVYYATILSRR